MRRGRRDVYSSLSEGWHMMSLEGDVTFGALRAIAIEFWSVTSMIESPSRAVFWEVYVITVLKVDGY